MAPRRRSWAAGASPAAAPPTLLSLPNDLLLRCLGQLLLLLIDFVDMQQSILGV